MHHIIHRCCFNNKRSIKIFTNINERFVSSGEKEEATTLFTSSLTPLCMFT